MKRWLRTVLALLGGTLVTAASWAATGPGFRLPDGVRSVLVWMLFPGWLVAPWGRYELALLVDLLLYSAVLWFLLDLVCRRKK
jgi:hypothetical protein